MRLLTALRQIRVHSAPVGLFSRPFPLRYFSIGNPSPEARMQELLTKTLDAEVVKVVDSSGGCGDFFQVLVVSPKFDGLTMIKQHRMVNQVLDAEIGKMHGLTLRTMTPAQWQATKK